MHGPIRTHIKYVCRKLQERRANLQLCNQIPATVRFIDKLKTHVAAKLSREAAQYEMRIPNNVEQLFAQIRPGDVVLVEGKQHISRLIKIFTSSPWSHAALYVGKALLKSPQHDAKNIRQKFGAEAERLIIEALPGVGVVANPLTKYEAYNLRLCRPFKIHAEDLQTVIETVIGDLGKSYDERNIIDLAVQMLPFKIGPLRKRNVMACLGECSEFQVTCSGHIAKAFQKVRYPIMPLFIVPPNGSPTDDCGQYSVKQRHYSQIMPCDFELSPYFQIVNFNVVESGNFDYRKLVWIDDKFPNTLRVN